MMRGIERRIAELEEKAGLDREVKIVLIRNSLKCNTDCKGFWNIKLCSPFCRFKQNPMGVGQNGFIVFAPPCGKCEESILRTGEGIEE